MLRAFSNVRKSLLAGNNTVKYAKYAIGEFLLIVAGILVALQIQNWNEEKKDRAEEREILMRISSEVANHLSLLDGNMPEMLAASQGALDRIDHVFKGEPVSDPMAFLTDIARSGSTGFYTPRMQSITFDELVSSGKMQLIQRVELRDQISSYYMLSDRDHHRAEAIKGEYALITFDLVPRREESLNVGIDDLSEEDAARVVASVLDSELSLHVVPQRNRLKFLKGYWSQQIERANELLAAIHTELNN